MQLEANNISFRYSPKLRPILNDVSFSISEGERVGIVGPSGYGKSTFAKIIAGYEKPNAGEVLLDGAPIPKKGFNPVQMIYQHPEFSVNPRWKMEKTVNECHNPSEELLDKMGIEREWLTRWPFELSGGELQRFCITRVLTDKTKFLICDEITTMLDVITQAQIWEVILDVSKKNNMGLLVITHNMALAEKVCTRIVDITKINKLEESN